MSSLTSRFAPDRGLNVRMLVTTFLLGLLYVVFTAALIVLIKSAVLAIVVAGGLLFAQYWFSDRIALYAMNGHIVTAQEAPELHGVVDRLCALANVPKPAVAIADSDVPNAFATGRSPSSAVVCATTGLLRRLDTDELEAVLAHELSHIAHRDVAVMTVASFLGVLAGLITRFGLYAGLYGGFGERGGDGDGDGEDNTALVFVAVVAVSAVVYGISFVLTRALSRYRELAADRSAALLTGRPSVLAAALTKLSADMAQIPTKDLRHAEPFNAFFFTPALSPGFSLSSIFSTHPSLTKRLEQLAELSVQLGQEA